MAEPTVVSETLTLVDAAGRVTEDRSAAVRGEVVELLSDGSTRSTLFDLESQPSDEQR